MLVETIELKGRALDWAVSEIEYARMEAEGEPIKEWAREAAQTNPGPWSTDWLWGGPIIEREEIEVIRGNDLIFPKGNEKGEYSEPLWLASCKGSRKFHGQTPLQAAMRCYVAIKLGEEVEIPDGLMEEA